MVTLNKTRESLGKLGRSFGRLTILIVVALVLMVLFWGACTARVGPNEFGVEQVRFGPGSGINETAFGPGVYFVGPGSTMHTFPREIHLLEASNERQISERLTKNTNARRGIEEYYARRDRLLGGATHRTIEALNVQTSDGYAVSTDISVLYSITNPVQVAKQFGWGSLYVDAFVINTFRSGALATLGKMSAEDFYSEEARIKAVAEAEDLIRERFAERGFKVEELLLRGYSYGETYERSLQEKKVAVQLTVKNRKESLVNEERAKLRRWSPRATRRSPLPSPR
ncbi:MAG: hypothetical protein IT384_14930 [Deltaproteobacteria bacterium]|nr:hypothetical protein [Deltaproteobacteria bacterium]